MEMKPLTIRILAIILFGLSLNSFAQSQKARLSIPDSLLNGNGYDSISSISHLSTGVLWDRVIPHVDLLSSNGTTELDSAQGMSGFTAYMDLFYSSIDTSSSPSYDSIRDLYLGQQFGFDALPIMTFSYDYQYLKPEAIDSGYVSIVDSQLVNSDPTINPFETATFWHASTRYKEVPLNDTFQIVIPGALFFNNPVSSRYNILSMEIDLDDGKGYQPISYNQVKDVYYWKFRSN